MTSSLPRRRSWSRLGAREIVLIGQDITAWGRDLDTVETLADVVRAVAAVPGVEWLRLMYVQPDGVTDELLEAMARVTSGRCRYLDMPLQHASRPVLRAMRRSGDAEAFLSLISNDPGVPSRRRAAHHAHRRLPGETAADFTELLDVRAKMRASTTWASSRTRPRTEPPPPRCAESGAARTRSARAQRLRDVADTISVERVAERVGEVFEVLVQGVDEDEGVVVGRWRGQAPEIDGLVLLDRESRGRSSRPASWTRSATTWKARFCERSTR